MKHFLRMLFLLTLVGFTSLGYTQTGSCTVTDLVVQNVRLVDEATCTYAFDVAFTIEKNKYIFFQTYVEDNGLVTNNPNPWPNYWDCQNGTTSHQGASPDAPTSTTIGNPLLNVAIHDPKPNDTASVLQFVQYIPDPTVPIEGVVATTTITKFTLPNDLTRITIKGLQVSLSPELCGKPFVAVTDFFATNADRNVNGNNNNLPIQCVSCGLRTAVGFFGAVGQANCATLQYNITLTNNTTTALTGTYQVYADANGSGLLTNDVDVLITPATTFTIGAGVGTTTTISGTIPTQYGGFDLFLVASLTDGLASGAQSITLIPSTTCAPLPVKFKSFNAVRKNADVELTWETATEDNNRGFYVQRNTGGGWKDLGFVTSKAGSGNSSADLSYNYNDQNNIIRGVSQYRIMQVDLDGKAKLSDVRQVRGMAQVGKVTIYPNPSADGKVNVVFEDSKATWNVSVADMNGRTIRQFKGVSNSLLVDNLVPGMYMIRIVDTQTGSQANEKVIVNNR